MAGPSDRDASSRSVGRPADPNAGQYIVVARRYRPQDFSQLVGQGQVAQALANAIVTNRVGHAYLFTGARGVGKTSTARIFAKALNCQQGPTTTPCGQCDICLGIASGGDVDVIEIDGASNRGIDEIRQLRSNVNIRPSRARYKIYIIDEVHMLTTQAFNALLKTLEEPPEHVKFIFCTTEADKIPITVLSRCQRFDFAPIEMRSIVERLADICAQEQVEAEREALEIVARRAAGSMRDSQSLLEQLLSFGGQKITVADVHALLGTAHSSRLTSLVQCIARRDAAGALAEVDIAASEGVDLGALAEQLLGYLRDALAALVGCGPELLLHVPAAEHPALKQMGERLGAETMLAMAQIVDQSLARLRLSTQARTLVELMVIRLCKLEDLDDLPRLIAQLSEGLPPQATGVPRRLSPDTSAAPSVAGTASKPSARPDQAASLPPAPASPSVSAPPAAIRASASPLPESGPVQKKTLDSSAAGPAEARVIPDSPLDADPGKLAAVWKQVLSEIGDMTADFAGRAERVAISGPNRLVVHFRKAYTQAQQFCERPDRRQKIEQSLSRLLGKVVRIDFATLPDEAATAPSAEKTPARPSRRQRTHELQRHPLVRKAAELFDTEIVGVFEPAAAEEAPPVE